jgi:hypothetical protein
MVKRNKAVHALEGAAAISEAQTIIKRLIEEEELRDAVGRAIDSSHRVYDRISGTKKASKLVGDKRLQEEAIAAYDAIRKVTVGLTGVGKSLPAPKSKKKRGGFRRLVLLAGVGGAVAISASEGLRSKLLDAMFGKEEEFEYSPPPAEPAADSGTPLSAVES